MHYPAGTCGQHHWQQLVDQDEVPQVVDHENLLDTVDQFQLAERIDAGVADQHIQPHPHLAYRPGAGDCRIEIRQFQCQRRGPAGHRRTGRSGLFQGAAGTDDMRTAQGEHPHGFVTQAGIAAGDQRGATVKVQPGGDLLGGGLGTEGADGKAGIEADLRAVAIAAGQHGPACRNSGQPEELPALYCHQPCLHPSY